jgi:putative ABC transport system permease protein
VGGFWQDIAYGVRALKKRPLFTAVAVLSIAVGIGLNTAIFTLMNSILLKPLPYRDADRLVAIFSVSPEHLNQLNGVSVPDLFDWRQQAHSLEAIGAVVNNAVDFGVEQNGMPAERIQGENVTPSLLEALGVQPFMGRLISEAEDEVDHPAPVILISYRLWMRRFGGDKDILNRKILVNGAATSVIGVMPADFRLSDENGDYIAPIPLNHFQFQGSARFLTAVAKLRPGVTMGQAQAELESVEARLAERFPARDMEHGKPWTVRLQPIRQALFGFISRPIVLLQGAVGLVLLIACANVAALLLARASSRQTEITIRAALGAGRGRIIRQFLTESILLAALSGILGVAFAWGAVRVLIAMAPPWLPRLHAIELNAPVLAFSVGLSLLTGLIFGIIPAVQGSRSSLVSSLKDMTRGVTSGGTRNRLRSALVAGQLALALMLLAGSGLLIRSLLELKGADLGFDPRGLLTFRYRFAERQFAKPLGRYHGLPLWDISAVPAQTILQIYERLRDVPGVRSAAGIVYPPMTGNFPLTFTIEGRPAANADDFTADFFPVTPNFFATMKIKLLRGRDFTGRDTANAPWVAIINDTMARRFFPDQDPIGKHIRVDISPGDQPREVIAVVKDMPASHPQTKQDPAIFIPFIQAAGTVTGPYTGLNLQMTFVLRTQGEPMGALPAVRQAVEEIDRNRPLIDPRPEEAYLAEEEQYPRYYSILLSLFAAVSTALAAVGVYGVMAYSVEQRTREIGIRIALGAARWDVLKLVMRQALIVTASGLAAGIAGAATLTRFISSELWEVKSNDPATLAGVCVLLMAIAILACLIPTRRAVEVDPTTALRYE